MNWRSLIDDRQPCWQDYLPLLDSLDPSHFPDCAALQRLLPGGLAAASGRPVRFRPQDEIPGVDYERHIHLTGEVSTRDGCWHDLCNALVWARLPRIKQAMNALHCSAPSPRPAETRGALRDALTLFDECGAILACTDNRLLEAIANKDWRAAFGRFRHAWREATIVVAGHALLEKSLRPYKSMTANTLLLRIRDDFPRAARERRLCQLDKVIARHMLEGDLFTRAGRLAPLPLAGIPGWWPHAPQDERFYSDDRVFRPPRKDATPASVLHVNAGF